MNIGPALAAATVAATLGLGAARAADGAGAPAPAPAALQPTIETCATCHGTRGQSVSPAFPNLAAQTSAYIELQLKAFKDQARADPDAQAYMWSLAAELSDERIGALAAYYSAQPPAPGHAGNPNLVAQGRKLFEAGVPARGMPPCANCHGANAAGQGATPRLAGQHAPYLLRQLLVIQNVLRAAPVMHGVIRDLTRDQMQALVAYLESL